ncbi:MAG TPA: universal stress protein [Methyloceanibacter sp.]
MKLVKILLPINQRGTTEACAASAFRLAERSGAAIEVLHPCPAPADRLPYATELSPFYFEELIDVGQKQVALEKREAEIWLTKTAQTFPKVRAGLSDIEGLVATTVAMHAKGADLTVLPSLDESHDAFFASARDAALFQSGRPVLMVPTGTRSVSAETVVVAWKDAVEAVRALAAAASFLAEAKHVRLLSVTEHGDDETAAMIADYLTEGGASVELVRFPLQSHEVGQVLLDAAAGEGALLVMGAYGRWRWRERLFGGATQYVLRNTKVPVLMAH